MTGLSDEARRGSGFGEVVKKTVYILLFMAAVIGWGVYRDQNKARLSEEYRQLAYQRLAGMSGASAAEIKVAIDKHHAAAFQDSSRYRRRGGLSVNREVYITSITFLVTNELRSRRPHTMPAQAP